MTLYALGAVTVAGYRVHTGDTTSEASAVSAALVEAEQLLEEELRRTLASEERTQRLRIRADGKVYPPAYPVTAAGSYLIDGRAIVGASPDDFPTITIFARTPTPYATITYTGGFTADTFPVTLRHALYDLANGIISAHLVPVMLVGATSASVGDVSASYGTGSPGGIDVLRRGLSERVARYRNRFL